MPDVDPAFARIRIIFEDLWSHITFVVGTSLLISRLKFFQFCECMLQMFRKIHRTFKHVRVFWSEPRTTFLKIAESLLYVQEIVAKDDTSAVIRIFPESCMQFVLMIKGFVQEIGCIGCLVSSNLLVQDC